MIIDKTIKSIEKAVFLGMNSSWKVLQSLDPKWFLF